LRVIARLVALNLGWLACVWCAATGVPWVGPIVVLWIAAVTLNFSRDFMADATLASAATLIGGATDAAMLAAGVFAFPESARFGAPSPAWMLALWFQFGLHMRVLMPFAIGRPWLAATLGVVFGPLACVTARSMGAITFTDDALVFGAIAAQYGVAVLLLERLLSRIDGMTDKQFTPARASIGVVGGDS